MGQEDADRALAVIVAVFSFTSMPMILPLAHRSPTVTRRVLAFLSLLSVASIAFFYRQAPFDYLHPRRTVVLHTENITSIPATHTLHFATIDSAPGFGDTVESVVDGLGLDKASMSSGMLNDHIPVGFTSFQCNEHGLMYFISSWLLCMLRTMTSSFVR